MKKKMEERNWLGLEERVCVVTGAASGIGLATVQALAEAGAAVGLVDIDARAATDLAVELRAQGIRAAAVGCDVSSKRSVDAAAATLEAELGPAYALINNAGLLRAGALRDISLEDWNALLAVNLNGYLLCAQAFGKQMEAAGGGAIVNIASIAAFYPQTNSAAYSASKAGVVQLSRQIAVEWGPAVRSNCICPGMIKTAMTSKFYEEPGSEAQRAAMTASRRVGMPDDIANVTIFLASPRSSYVNATEIFVTGGLDAMLLDKVPRSGFNRSATAANQHSQGTR